MDMIDQYFCPICHSSLIEEPLQYNKQKLKCSDRFCYYIYTRTVDKEDMLTRFLGKLRLSKKSNEFKDEQEVKI